MSYSLVKHEPSSALEPGLIAAGRVDHLNYTVEPGNPPQCRVRCLHSGVVDEPRRGRGSRWEGTYWDSRLHGITWPHIGDALETIAKAYPLLDHRIGEQEEWHASPVEFELGFNGAALSEHLHQPGWKLPWRVQRNNGTLLVGQEGSYGLLINVGGKGWKSGYTAHALAKCAAIERLARGWFRTEGPRA